MANGAAAWSSLEAAVGQFDPSQADRVIAREVDSVSRSVTNLTEHLDRTATRLEGKVEETASVLYRRLWWMTTAMFSIAGAVIVALVAAVVARG